MTYDPNRRVWALWRKCVCGWVTLWASHKQCHIDGRVKCEKCDSVGIGKEYVYPNGTILVVDERPV
jgi:hypothetical protein